MLAYLRIAFLLTLIVNHGHADTILKDLVAKTRAARLSGDVRAWLDYGQKTLALAPDHPDLLISMARALAANGKLEESERLLHEAIERGAGFDLFTFAEFSKHRANQKLHSLGKKGIQNMKPLARAMDFAAIEDPKLRPEGIVYDRKTDRFFIGSAHGEIWQIDKAGKVTPFISGTGLREVYGMKVDESRRILWAVTGVFPDLFVTGEPKKDVGIGGLHAYNIDQRKKVSEVWLDERPILHGFNDLAVANNGDVFITDTETSAVYRLVHGDKKFEVLVRNSKITFPNGIVLAPDQKHLYIAHVEGVSRIDIMNGQVRKLAVPSNVSIHSMDGLAWDGKDLLGIQGSPYLSRVIRIRLNRGGTGVQEVRTISSRTPIGYSQTTGAIAGRNFFVVSGLQLVPSTSGQTQPRNAPSRIVRIPLE
jgi:sugar lactone lactonase YvrE